VSTIEAAEVLNETAPRTNEGSGVCVGRKFDSIDWRIIRITDHPISTIDDAEELRPGEIGELIVRGPQTSPRYVTYVDANAASKIAEGGNFWHRMGDVGYLDHHMRFWYCGRKSQRVETSIGTLYTECVEAIFNAHPGVCRSALVAIEANKEQTAVLIVEPKPAWFHADWSAELLKLAEGRDCWFDHFLVVNWRLPVDVRHNAKINREKLAAWAAKRFRAVHVLSFHADPAAGGNEDGVRGNEGA
jgi:acyl-coenzyme A synthetase/AMP-(fatty) acid ligase